VTDASRPPDSPTVGVPAPTKNANVKAPAPVAAELPLCSFRVASGLAFLTGTLYFLAFPGIDIWPLSIVTWVPLLVALRGRNPKDGLRLAWISGFTMTFVGFYWMLEMLQTFSGFGTPLCILFMAILAAYQGGRIALFGWLANRLQARAWWRGPSLALAFAVSEVCYPLLFPWYFGATVHQVPALLQLAELGGPILVGLVLFGVNYAIAEVVVRRLRKQAFPARLLVVHAGLIAVTALYGLLRIASVDEATRNAPKGRVGLVQANMGLFEKRQDRNEGLRRHLELSRELERKGPLDLIVWSETSVAGGVFEEEANDVYERLVTRHLHTPVLFGALLMREVSDARRVTLFNSVLISDHAGKVVGRYDKRALLAFGEYLPLGELFPILYEWSPNTGKFTAGRQLAALPLGDIKVSAHICYEDVLPDLVNDLVVADGADLLANLTNDAWYGDSTQPWIHLALAKFRAIEHRKYFVRSTNSGVSAFIDPAGRVPLHSGTFEKTTLVHEVAYLSGGPTVFERLGHAPYWLCALLTLLGCFVPRSALGRR
jgi:apolipoprotein N-acyltransferase